MIVPEEAKVVQEIFVLYLEGKSLLQIKKHLEGKGIKTSTGKEKWDTKTIQQMLSNEKYMGDSKLQKTFIEDYLTGKKVKNTGQRTSYYVKNSHEGIISRELFEKVQEEHEKRNAKKVGMGRYNSQNILNNLMVCGYCGANYRRRTERGKVVYRCGTRMEKGREQCEGSVTIREEWIQGILVDLVGGQGEYDTELVKSNVDNVIVFVDSIDILEKNGNVKKFWI